MPVRAELRWRRLVVAVLLVVALPAFLAFIAVAYQRPDLPPGPPAYDPLPLGKQPVLAAVQARELQRSRRVTDEAGLLTAPQVVPPTFPERVPTVVLPPRAEPYGLAEVQQLLPAAFQVLDGALLLRASLEVPAGARLTIDGATTPDVRLSSRPDGFTTVISRGGEVDVRGTAAQPVRISSWDDAAGRVDDDPSDGRSFLVVFGGRMDISHADIGHLGFGTGTSSGVAWRAGEGPAGTPPVPATGVVESSTLHDNWFGAYTFEAVGMRFTDNTFADNAAYGFDPHDLSNDFLVERNTAHGNGRHGFIFSRGCDRNVLRDNVAYDNRGHGFMIDDGRSEDSTEGAAARLPSNDNQLIGNRAHDNDGSGIEIEGGVGTVVTGNVLQRNHVGVRVKNDASVRISDNHVVDSRFAGVDVLSAAPDIEVRGNEVRGGWASIALTEPGAARLTGNELVGASTPLVVAGQAVRDEGLASEIGRVFRWNPLLVLWAGILGVPAVFAVRRLARWVVPGRRRARALPG
jgi:parallel beta-helix repeat protein